MKIIAYKGLQNLRVDKDKNYHLSPKISFNYRDYPLLFEPVFETIATGIEAFITYDDVLVKSCDEAFYIEWVKFHILKEDKIHTIIVDGIKWSLGDIVKDGTITKFIWSDEWLAELNDGYDGTWPVKHLKHLKNAVYSEKALKNAFDETTLKMNITFEAFKKILEEHANKVNS